MYVVPEIASASNQHSDIIIPNVNTVRSEIISTIGVPSSFDYQLKNLLSEFSGLSIDVKGTTVVTNTLCCALTKKQRKCKNYSMIGDIVCYAHRLYF